MILEGDRKRRVRDHDDERVRNYELAGLIAYAQHDPKNMPTFKATGDDRAQSNEADAERVRGYFIGLALTSEGKK